MTILQIIALVLVAAGATAVALTHDPVRQALVATFYSIVLEVLFFVFSAPDVALAQIAIGTVVVPLLLVLALAKIRRDAEAREAEE